MRPSTDRKHALERDILYAKKQKTSGNLAGNEEPIDTALYEEDVGVGAKRKKNLKVDDYDDDSAVADSSDDDGKSPSADNKTVASDNDDDMFGERPRKNDKSGKNDDGNETDGQEQETHTNFMDIVDEEDTMEQGDYDSDEKEVGALGRKTNAPRIDAYNMLAELEEGDFDESGNYVRKMKDQKDNQDNWLKTVSRKDIDAAREAVHRKKQEEVERIRKEDEEEGEASIGDLLMQLISFLDRGETVLDCLARLGASSKGIRRKKSKGKEPENPHVLAIEKLTKIASLIMRKAPQIDVYGTEKEGLARIYKRESGIELDLTRGRDEVMQDDDEPLSKECWEFVWMGAEDSINGPYDTQTMQSWLQDGLLRQSDGKQALVRRVGEITFIEASMATFDV